MSQIAKPLNILLVEANPADRELLETQLSQAAETTLLVECEVSLEFAVRRVRESDFDVVLLDLSLPDSDGLATLELLQANARDTPIIVLTGLDDSELGIRAVSGGAQDYLLKDKIDSDSLIRSIRYARERARRISAEGELAAAGTIQRRFLPRETPSVPGFDVCGRCMQATFAGGDFFDFFTMGANHLGVVVADVAGHGIGPAITMSETRAVVRSFVTVTNDVGEVLTRSNRVLARDLNQETFVALFLARINVATRTLEFATAGHTGFVLTAHGTIKQILKSNHPPLGIETTTVYGTSRELALSQGDSLFLFTDGFSESVGSSGEPFGKKRVFESVKAECENGATAMIGSLFKELESFRQSAHPDDDVTAVVVKGSPAPTDPTLKRVPPTGSAHSATPTQGGYEFFDVDRQNGAAVLRIRVEEILSSQKCAQVRAELVSYLRTEKPNRVVISFQSVKRFSSEGINICFQAKSTIDDLGGQLRLCEMNQQLREAFKALNLDGTVFQIHDDITQAQNSF